MNSSAFPGIRTTGTWLSRVRRLLHAARGWLPARALQPGDKSFLYEQVVRMVIVTRAFVAVMGLAVLGIMEWHTEFDVPLVSTAAIVALLFTVSWAGYLRLQRETPVGESDVMLQLVSDILILTIVLSLWAGRKSPFDHLYVLPVLVGSHALRGWRMAFLALVITVGWTTVNQVAGPGPQYPETVEIAGHLVTGAVLAYIALAVAHLSRKHEQMLSTRREQELAALGDEASHMVAARAANALNTPLGTMAVLVSDLRQGRVGPEEQQQSFDMLAAQIASSKARIDGLLDATGHERGEGGYRADVLQLLQEIREECLLRHPAGRVRLAWPEDAGRAPDIVVESALFNAVTGLVKELLQEGHEARVSASWDSESVMIRIGGDRRVAPHGPERAGRLALVSSIVDRHGGEVHFEPGGGRRIAIRLPHVEQRRIQTEGETRHG